MEDKERQEPVMVCVTFDEEVETSCHTDCSPIDD